MYGRLGLIRLLLDHGASPIVLDGVADDEREFPIEVAEHSCTDRQKSAACVHELTAPTVNAIATLACSEQQGALLQHLQERSPGLLGLVKGKMEELRARAQLLPAAPQRAVFAAPAPGPSSAPIRAPELVPAPETETESASGPTAAPILAPEPVLAPGPEPPSGSSSAPILAPEPVLAPMPAPAPEPAPGPKSAPIWAPEPVLAPMPAPGPEPALPSAPERAPARLPWSLESLAAVVFRELAGRPDAELEKALGRSNLNDVDAAPVLRTRLAIGHPMVFDRMMAIIEGLKRRPLPRPQVLPSEWLSSSPISAVFAYWASPHGRHLVPGEVLDELPGALADQRLEGITLGCWRWPDVRGRWTGTKLAAYLEEEARGVASREADWGFEPGEDPLEISLETPCGKAVQWLGYTAANPLQAAVFGDLLCQDWVWAVSLREWAQLGAAVQTGLVNNDLGVSARITGWAVCAASGRRPAFRAIPPLWRKSAVDSARGAYGAAPGAGQAARPPRYPAAEPAVYRPPPDTPSGRAHPHPGPAAVPPLPPGAPPGAQPRWTSLRFDAAAAPPFAPPSEQPHRPWGAGSFAPPSSGRGAGAAGAGPAGAGSAGAGSAGTGLADKTVEIPVSLLGMHVAYVDLDNMAGALDTVMNQFDVLFVYVGASYNGPLPRSNLRQLPLPGNLVTPPVVIIRKGATQRKDEADVYAMWDIVAYAGQLLLAASIHFISADAIFATIAAVLEHKCQVKVEVVSNVAAAKRICLARAPSDRFA